MFWSDPKTRGRFHCLVHRGETENRPRVSAWGEEPCQVYWIGLVGLEQANKNGEEFLASGHNLLIYAGGERKYGLGELELVYVKEAESLELAEWNLDREGNLNLLAGQTLKNFLPLEEKTSFIGGTVLLAEDPDFTELVPRIKKAACFIKPGSLVKKPECYKGEEYRLEKGRFGKSSD